MARLLLGGDRSHLLFLVFAVGHRHRGSASGDRSPRRHILQREVPSRERRVSRPLALGLRLLLLRRDEAKNQGEAKARNPGRTASINAGQSQAD